MQGVSRERRYNRFPQTGYGYIVIPQNVDKDEYINDCYLRERVCILTDQGGSMVKDCYITKNAIRDIEFPDIADNKNKTGSAIVFVTDTYNNKPTIIGVLSKEDETQFLNPHLFKQEKKYGKKSVSIEGDAKNGVLSINVEDNDNLGVLNISVKGKTGGKINIKCQGDSNFHSDGNTNISSIGNIALKTYNKANGEVNCSVDITGTNVEIVPKNVFKIASGVSPIPKGDKNETVLSDIRSILNDLGAKLTTYSATQATASIGALAPLAAGYTQLGTDMSATLGDIASLVSKIAEINSVKSFTD
jgi:hypothetical protein